MILQILWFLFESIWSSKSKDIKENRKRKRKEEKKIENGPARPNGLNRPAYLPRTAPAQPSTRPSVVLSNGQREKSAHDAHSRRAVPFTPSVKRHCSRVTIKAVHPSLFPSASPLSHAPTPPN